MKKIYLDTNSIISYLLDRNKEQANAVESLLKKSESNENYSLILLHEVILEAYYVLNSFYKLNKIITSEKLIAFINKDFIKVTQKEMVLEAFSLHLNQNIKILDTLLYLKAKQNNAKVFSFDNDFKKLEKQ